MINIPITFQSDEKGYFDRECPNENCLFTFKINMQDWEEKVSDDEVHCPLCGHIDTSDKWWTQEQLSAMQEVVSNWAVSYIQNELDKSFKKLERSTHGNKFIKTKYKPGHKTTFINNPLGQSPEWEQEIQCPNCQTRYSVIGSAFFCPCCGYNVIETTFDESLDSISKMIEALPEMEAMLTSLYGKDKAVVMCRSMLEGSIGDVVSVFQKYAEARYSVLSNAKARSNDFQIIEKGSDLFKALCGFGYEQWLTDDELRQMNVMFQRRHLYEHNGGIVDTKYVEKSGDQTYRVGQRIVAQKADVVRFISIAKKLGEGLKSVHLGEPL